MAAVGPWDRGIVGPWGDGGLVGWIPNTLSLGTTAAEFTRSVRKDDKYRGEEQVSIKDRSYL
jgi:hypothetical protein